MNFKQGGSKFFQGIQENQAEYIAGNHFPRPHGEHHEGDGDIHAIGVPEHPRHNQRVGEHRRERHEPRVVAQEIGTGRADQGGEGSEQDIHGRAAGEPVAEKTADGEAGNGRGGKTGKNCQSLGKADLDIAVRQIEGACDKCQYDIEGGSHGRLACEINLFVHFSLLSFF